ncbi:MAG: hypothetical protein IT338_20140 [Thermomicrobiales bacterium]|nr:hypothetical protein [Thermomicrobiales bacterium]
MTGGSSIVVAAWRVAQRPECVRSLGATWAWLTPGLLETLLARPEAEGIRDWPLRFIRSGSAQVTPDLIVRC